MIPPTAEQTLEVIVGEVRSWKATGQKRSRKQVRDLADRLIRIYGATGCFPLPSTHMVQEVLVHNMAGWSQRDPQLAMSQVIDTADRLRSYFLSFREEAKRPLVGLPGGPAL